MYKKQMTAQKIIVLAMLLSCALAFISSLGFLTGAYEVLYPGISQRGDKFAGCRLFEEFQVVNRTMTNISIALIVVSLLLFITGCNTRRKYYGTNYIASIFVPIVSITLSVKCIIDALSCKARFLNETDFEKLKTLAESDPNKYTFSKSTFWYDFVVVAYAIVIVVSVLVVLNMILKIILMNSENKLLNESKEVRSS